MLRSLTGPDHAPSLAAIRAAIGNGVMRLASIYEGTLTNSKIVARVFGGLRSKGGQPESDGTGILEMNFQIESNLRRLREPVRSIKLNSLLRAYRSMDDFDRENITVLMVQASNGEPKAAEKLLPLVYDQLKQLARQRMVNERKDHTLQPTALVHEAYLRLVGNGEVAWQARAQFLFAAAQAMRRILVDHARAHGSFKRGGGRKRLPAGVLDLVAGEQSSQILALDDALCRLESISPGVGEVVRLRFFGGLSVNETAAALGVSPRTVKRDWTYARAWLCRELGNQT